MRHLACSIGNGTFIHATVFHLYFSNVEMADDVSNFGYKLTNRHAPIKKNKQLLSVEYLKPMFIYILALKWIAVRKKKLKSRVYRQFFFVQQF